MDNINNDYFGKQNTTLSLRLNNLKYETSNAKIEQVSFSTIDNSGTIATVNVTTKEVEVDFNKPYRKIIKRKIIDG